MDADFNLDQENRETWGRLNMEAFHDYAIHLTESRQDDAP